MLIIYKRIVINPPVFMFVPFKDFVQEYHHVEY